MFITCLKQSNVSALFSASICRLKVLYIFAIFHFVKLQDIIENSLHSEEIILFIKLNPELFSKGTITDIKCELSIHSLLNDDG